MGFRVDEYPDDPNLPAGTHNVFIRDAKEKVSKKGKEKGLTEPDMLLLEMEAEETGQEVTMFFMLNKRDGWKIKKVCSVIGLNGDEEHSAADFIDRRFRLQMTRSENGMANFVDALRVDGDPKREPKEEQELPF